jgi:hypothetical protein
MPFLCHLPDGTKVNTDDLPLEAWEEVRLASDVEWWRVMMAPALYPAGAVALLKVCAESVGQSAPPSGYLTPKTVTDVFEAVADDLPTGHDERGVPDPKAEGGSGTTPSSGSSGDSVGRRRSSVSSRSETSTS